MSLWHHLCEKLLYLYAYVVQITNFKSASTSSLMNKHCVFGKVALRCSILFLVMLVQYQALAQKNTIAYRDSLFTKYADNGVHHYAGSDRYYICSWEKTPSSIKIIRPLDEGLAIIEVSSQEVFDELQRHSKVAPATNDWKLSATAINASGGNPNNLKTFILTGLHTKELLAALKKLPGITVFSVDEPSHSAVVRASTKYINTNLLPLKPIIFIDLRATPQTEVSIIGYNRSFHGINAVDYSVPGANGKNIVAGVKEQQMEATDLDLHKRVLTSPLAATATENHATVIASIIGGAGNSFYDGRGIANGCTFFPSSFSNLFPDDAALLNTNKVSVQNHSYGTIIQQFYGAEAVSYDAHTWNNKQFLHVFSAGNKGTSAATDGRYANLTGFANLTGNFKLAKNLLTIGAIDNKGTIAAESSAGPLYDGRIAPQLVALGPNGTSDAAAIVSGTIAVLQQVYADSNSQVLPPASLIKAILYNTAEDIYRTGIDYKTGYGLLNSLEAVKAIQQKKYDGSSLTQGLTWTRTITVPPNAAQLKITLAWTDSAAIVNNNKALINDLDLEVEELSSGTIYKPWVLSVAAHADSLNKLPLRKRDSLNTAEQISIALPAAGTYQIRVTGTTITGATPFHIAYNSDSLNIFHFTSPQHASDVIRAEEETLFIRWKTFVADTNQTGNLYISYNSGTNWQLIKSAHKIYTNQYTWPIKDTASTALLRMETIFGDFLSTPFIISPVTRPEVDFLCADSFRLSWNKHIYANNYKLYTLTDSPYLKHILTVTDTFVVLNRALYSRLVYAVEPVLSNGLPAARSIAFDITQQGVKCFYKTFYYNQTGPNSLDLVLELSIAAYTDSVFFEQVSATGQLKQSFDGIRVIGNDRIYHQLVNELPGGTTYWRAKIKLKNGQLVYTDIISLLTPGKRMLLFYPNPANRNEPLNYVLQQGIPTDSRLQFFDVSGHLLKEYASIPVTISLSALPVGVLIYKLVSINNEILETGKLVVR